MSVTSTEKKRRFVMFALLGVAVTVVLAVGYMVLFAPKKPSASATLASARTDSVKGQAGGEGSEEYNKKLEAHDQQKANSALAAGESFIPTPVGTKTPAVTPASPAGHASACGSCTGSAHGQHPAKKDVGRPSGSGCQIILGICGTGKSRFCA